jgi:hypothetical protein
MSQAARGIVLAIKPVPELDLGGRLEIPGTPPGASRNRSRPVRPQRRAL